MCVPRARLSPGIQRAREVRLSPQPAEAPARGAREKGRPVWSTQVSSLRWDGAFRGRGHHQGTPRPHLSNCEPVLGGRREKDPAAANPLAPRSRPDRPPARPQLALDRAMRGSSAALWFCLALRTGETPPPSRGSRSRGGDPRAPQSPLRRVPGTEKCALNPCLADEDASGN